MEKKVSVLVLLFVGLLTSCIGDIGPQGPPGFDGFDGLDGLDGADGLIGSIFEVEGTFTQENTYEFFADIPTTIDILDTDIVIAYVLSGTNEGVDIWEPLPQTLFIEDEILLYGYDFTVADVRFFLDGNIDFASLDALYTDDILFRVAVIPADFAATINTASLNEVMSAMQIESVDIVR